MTCGYTSGTATFANDFTAAEPFRFLPPPPPPVLLPEPSPPESPPPAADPRPSEGFEGTGSGLLLFASADSASKSFLDSSSGFLFAFVFVPSSDSSGLRSDLSRPRDNDDVKERDWTEETGLDVKLGVVLVVCRLLNRVRAVYDELYALNAGGDDRSSLLHAVCWLDSIATRDMMNMKGPDN